MIVFLFPNSSPKPQETKQRQSISCLDVAKFPVRGASGSSSGSSSVSATPLVASRQGNPFEVRWTCTLVTIYFAFGSSISIYGCCKSGNRVDGNEADSMSSAEQGDYIPPTMMEAAGVSSMAKSSNINEERDSRKTAGAWIYTFQIIYQTCAGAVALTDAVFWLILYPFLTSKDFGLNFLLVCMHSVNAVFLLGDTILNSMRFPMFRIAYFILWTATFVIFQWILHACVNLWWPYSFLDLSSSYAPLWYVGVGLMHLLCYGFFSSFVRLKHFWFSRSFPGSYRALR